MGIDTVDGGGAVAVGYAQNNVVFGQLGTFRNGGYTDGFLTRYSGAATGIAREAENNDLATAAPAGRMVLYPNPATGLVHIKIAELADKVYPLTIVDMQGKEVFADTYTAEQLAAGVSISLKPIAGLYMVRCANTTAKLVVE
jgi:hypothetical protein